MKNTRILLIALGLCITYGCQQKEGKHDEIQETERATMFYFNDTTQNKDSLLEEYLIGRWEQIALLYSEDFKHFYCSPNTYSSVSSLEQFAEITIENNIIKNIDHFWDTIKWKVDYEFINNIENKIKETDSLILNGLFKKEIRFYKSGDQIVRNKENEDFDYKVASVGKFKISSNGDIYEQTIRDVEHADSSYTSLTKVVMFGKGFLLVSSLDQTSLGKTHYPSEHFIRCYKRLVHDNF